MVAKVYFDGSSDRSRTRRTVTLAAFAGTSEWWLNIEKQWSELLALHRIPFVHTTDLVGRHGVFNPNKWDGDPSSVLEDCVKVIERCSVKQRSYSTDQRGLLGMSISMDIGSFESVKSKGVGTPEQACADGCMGVLDKWCEDLGITRLQLIFDQNEAFRGHVLDRARNPKAKKHDRIWQLLRCPDSIIESKMDNVPGLQVADLCAWVWTKKHQGADFSMGWQKRLLDLTEWTHHYHSGELRPDMDAVNTIV